MTACIHPAVEALGRVRNGVAPEGPVDLLWSEGKSSIYRISQPECSIIAKHCLAHVAQRERQCYEEILPLLPVRSLEYYGYAEDDGAHGWIFTEDSGGRSYSDQNGSHRRRAAQWFAAMHSATSMKRWTLADRTPAGYLAQLRAARANVLASQNNRVLPDCDKPFLLDLVRKLDRVEARWDRVQSACDAAPYSFVHADLQPKNLHVRPGGRQTRIFPLDWEHSGWGSPAVDLAYLDADCYQHSIQPQWREFTLADARRLARLGRLMQTIAAIEWGSQTLGSKYVEDAIQDIRCYHLPDFIDELLDC